MTALRTSLDPATLEISRMWIAKAEEQVWQQLGSPSLARLQALILCIAYRLDTGSFQQVFMLAGLAARGATALRLNHERQDLDPVTSEGRRRTLWSLKILEVYFSIGLRENELLAFENVYIRLPLQEHEFNDRRAAPEESGSYSSFVKLASIRRDMMKLNRSLAMCDQW